MKAIERAIFLKTQLDALRPLDREQESRIMQKFRLDWNYHSNHLEGNTLTFGETKALILFGTTAQGKPLKDHIEISGHDEAIKWVTEVVRGDMPLTENFIRELHTLLLKEPYQKEAITPDGLRTKRLISVGKYKTEPNHVLTSTGEIFRFASPEETPAMMHDLLSWYHTKDASPDTIPLLLAGEFHYRFIRIHPFDDGNGRTARILMNFILMKHGYPPAIIKTEDKQNYFTALRQADAGTLEPFLDYIAENLVRSLEIMIAGAKGESIDEPDDIDKEVALLEQRLKVLGNPKIRTLDLDAAKEIQTKALVPLANKFLVAFLKFEKLFLESQFFISGGKGQYLALTGQNPHLEPLSKAPQYLGLIFKFKTLKTAGLADFKWDSNPKIYLHNNEWGIDNLGSFPYGHFPTEKQLDDLVKAETAKLTAAIEAYIQKKSS